MAQGLRAAITFLGDLSSVISTHVGWVSCLYTAPGDPSSLDSMGTHNDTHFHGHTDIQNLKKNLNLCQGDFCFA